MVSGGALQGKVAIVTGAGRGIGKGIALEYGREGALVVVASRTLETVVEVSDQIRASGGEAIGVTCDVGKLEDIRSLVDRSVEHFGPVDVLVNNAQSLGTPDQPMLNTPVPLEDYPEDRWDYVFDSGAKATFRAMQAVFPSMKERGGKIINLGSPAAQHGREGLSAYNANKEAIRGLSRTAAREWGKYGINVNVISPSIQTDRRAEALSRLDAETQRQTLLAIPLRRVGLPVDAGRLAVFLASPDSDLLTGMTFMLDGGKSVYSL